MDAALDSQVDAVLARVVGALDPLEVHLFGSRARGTAAPDSDIDLLVVVDSPLPLAELTFRARRALRDLGIAVDLIVVKPEDARRLATWKSSVVAEAFRDGRKLYAAAS